MTTTTIRIRKNATRKLQALYLEATKYELETQTMRLDDSFESNGTVELTPEQFDEWFENNYKNMDIQATYDSEGKPLRAVFTGAYYFSDTVVITFGNEEKEEKPKFTIEQVTDAIKDGFISPLNSDEKIEEEQPTPEELAPELPPVGRCEFTRYLETLITEKGRDIDDTIKLEGNFGLTYRMLISALSDAFPDTKETIRKKFVEIDYKNGDVFEFFKYMAEELTESAQLH